MPRPTWNQYFLELARTVSLRADCTRSAVGAVLVNDRHRVISTGYNGSPPGAASCLAGACPRGRLGYGELPPGGSYSNCIANHAEWNAIVFAPDPKGAILYITRKPCDDCMTLIAESGVIRAVWPDGSWVR